MSHIPGLNYAQPKPKSKASKADGRQCQVVDVSHGRCLVTFTLKGCTQRAVLPLDRLYSEQGPCGRKRPPGVGEKILCDMIPVQNTAVNAQWLVAFAWRGKLDSAPKSGPLTAVTGMLYDVKPDSGVLLFVTPAGCRERCAFGRSAVQPEGSPLPVSEPLSRHLEAGETCLFDCRPTTAAANCRWLADKVWFSATSEGDSYEDGEKEEESEDGGLAAGEPGQFILRETLKDVVGRADLVQNYKAVLTFDHAGQRHRALLLTAKYSFPEKATAVERRDLTKVLSRGDHVLFTCHEYDKPNGSDRCGWWVMAAVKHEKPDRSVGREAGYFQSGLLYEKIGTVKDVFAAEGLLHFVLDGRREVAWFSSQEVFINGRPCEGRLSDALETGQRVHFNAEPSPAPRGADWRCTCVWRGEMPTVEASKKRIEAAAVKKQKKPKSAKSRIDDLDDFEVPAGPPSAAGDSWGVTAATVHVPQSSPLHTGRGHPGGGDRAGRAGRQPPPLRASMVDGLDDFDTTAGGSSGGLSGGVSGDGGSDWTQGGGGGGSWADEPDPLAAEEPPAESASSGPSRPLSDASLEHALGPRPGPIQSPSRAAAAAASRQSPVEPGRPPLLPLLEHSVPLPDPSLPRPPLLPTPDRLAWSAGGYTHTAEPSAASSQARGPPPPGLPGSPRRLSDPAEPPGLSPAALAAAAAANYQHQQRAAQAAASLLGGPPGSRPGTGLLPTPPLASLYGYWQPGLMAASPQMARQAEQQVAAHLMYGAGLTAPPPPGPVMPPLAVDQESLDQMVKGGRLPDPAAKPPPAGSQPRTVPAADWEAAAAAFKAALDPEPSQPKSSPTMESVERRQTPTAGVAEPAPVPAESEPLEPLSDRLSAAGLGGGPQQLTEGGTETNGLDDVLDELEADAVPSEGEDEPPPSPPPAAEPVSGRGQILAFVDESRGLAEWNRDGHIEQVMFDRDVCYWLDAPMDTLDLTDCYTPGAEVLFECVPAAPEEPYQWVATHFRQVEA